MSDWLEGTSLTCTATVLRLVALHKAQPLHQGYIICSSSVKLPLELQMVLMSCGQLLLQLAYSFPKPVPLAAQCAEHAVLTAFWPCTIPGSSP